MGRALQDVGVASGERSAGRVRPSRSTTKDLTDRELVLAFQQGDTAAFDEIYRRYRARAERVGRHYVASADDAEELAQEAMIRVLRSLHGLGGDYAVKAWVDRITTNVALDHLRARARRGGTAAAVDAGSDSDSSGGGPAGTGAPAGPDPSDVAESLACSRAVRDTLDNLPRNHRAALVLREVEGRSHVEIGAALGISPFQAKALIHRARRGFRRAWKADGSSPLPVVVPLLWPSRLREAVRHLVEPARWDRTVAAASSAAPGPAEQVAAALTAMVLAGGLSGAMLVPRSLQAAPSGPAAAAARHPGGTGPAAGPARPPRPAVAPVPAQAPAAAWPESGAGSEPAVATGTAAEGDGQRGIGPGAGLSPPPAALPAAHGLPALALPAEPAAAPTPLVMPGPSVDVGVASPAPPAMPAGDGAGAQGGRTGPTGALHSGGLSPLSSPPCCLGRKRAMADNDPTASNVDKDPDEWVTGDEPMTGAQASYLKTLADEAGVAFDEKLTKAEASKRIDELRQQSSRLAGGGGETGPG